MGTMKEALLDLVGSSEFETLVRMRKLDEELGAKFEKVRRAGDYVRSARKDIDYKLERCKEDWENIDRMFYAESLTGDVANYERKLAEYRIYESDFADYANELSIPRETLLDVLYQARTGARRNTISPTINEGETK